MVGVVTVALAMNLFGEEQRDISTCLNVVKIFFFYL